MSTIVRFQDEGGSTHGLVGGKGANLGLLACAGFPVPPGFTVTTAGYSAFMNCPGVADRIAELVKAIDFDDHSSVESRTADIRELILGTPFPADLETDVTKAHAELDAKRVAVRSSGTAEDLADSSFAGLHDTYLDVTAEGVLVAVRECWASLWTPRATAYRQSRGFDHTEAQMAVVVQAMVRADVAGVAFTGNPLTAATNETVIDASWGLGEAVVSGLVTPDHYVFRTETLYDGQFAHFGAVGGGPLGKVLRLKDKVLGSKEARVVRDPATGAGVVTEAVPGDLQSEFCLSDGQAGQVAELGRRVMSYYAELPQDIEWAFEDGQLYLLQSRPITGVNFSWDEDVDAWQTVPEPQDAVWTRAIADEIWTGAITPLMYSIRSQLYSAVWHFGLPYIGRDDLRSVRLVKYWKGEAYCNVEHERAYSLTAPPFSRPGVVGRLPQEQQAEVLSAPWRSLDYVKTLAKFNLMHRKSVYGRPVGASGGVWGHFKVTQDYMDNRVDEARGLSDEQLRSLSDSELKQYINKQNNFEMEYVLDFVSPGWFIYARDMVSFLAYVVTTWYDGDNPNAFLELLTGTPRPTVALRENVELRELTNALRARPAVLARFEDTGRDAFFAGVDATSEGQEFLELCQAFVEKNGHRGHSDRDIYFPRYADDWRLLYDSINVHLKVDDDPLLHLATNNARRSAVIEDVVANLKRKPLGFLRAEAFKIALDYSLKFIEIRDNERFFVDYSTYSIRKGFCEVNRRIMERELLETDIDFWFLGREELYEVLDGRANMKLAEAKIAGRKRNFELFHHREVNMPRFLYHEEDLETGQSKSLELEDGRIGFRGVPTSRGVIEGTARLVKQLAEIGRVSPGEIAIVHATDPGWTPLFALARGIVAETGGMLSHCSSLAREHGLPAVQLENALNLIPDGALIRVDGNTGQVELLDRSLEPVERASGPA